MATFLEYTRHSSSSHAGVVAYRQCHASPVAVTKEEVQLTSYARGQPTDPLIPSMFLDIPVHLCSNLRATCVQLAPLRIIPCFRPPCHHKKTQHPDFRNSSSQCARTPRQRPDTSLSHWQRPLHDLWSPDAWEYFATHDHANHRRPTTGNLLDIPRATEERGSSQRTCVVYLQPTSTSGISRYQMSTHRLPSHGVGGYEVERCCPEGNRSVTDAVTPPSPMGGVNYCVDLCTICGGHRHMQVMQLPESKSLPTDPPHRLLTTHKATFKATARLPPNPISRIELFHKVNEK